MNISGFKIPQFQLPQKAASAGPAQQQQPKAASPEFGGMAGIQGNLLNPRVGGPASPTGNRLNISA